MEFKKENIIKYRIERAEETLSDADTLIKKGSYNSAVNRIYYACFYSVLAILLRSGFKSSKHTGVLSIFLKEFVKTGIVSRNLGKFYNKLFQNRLKGDYFDFKEFTKEEAVEYFNPAKKFIAEIKKILNK